jgi:hypothetical protein
MYLDRPGPRILAGHRGGIKMAEEVSGLTFDDGNVKVIIVKSDAQMSDREMVQRAIRMIQMEA